MRVVSCGVIVSDGRRFLLGHATRSPRWDIPKGLAETGEEHRRAAIRELNEETGLVAPADALQDLGVQRYLPGKDLALFLWCPPTLPDPGNLACSSRFRFGAAELPEFDRFALVEWPEMISRVGKSLASVLAPLQPALCL